MIKDVREVWAEAWIREFKKKPVWRVCEIAKVLDVHVNTVLYWIKTGELKAVNITKSPKRPVYRVHRDDLIEFIKNRHSYVIDL